MIHKRLSHKAQYPAVIALYKNGVLRICIYNFYRRLQIA